MIVQGTNTFINASGRELADHGTAFFPLGCYEMDASKIHVPWHWHDDWEFILATEGTVQTLTEAGKIDLLPGEAVFLGAGCVHEITGAGSGCTLRSAVFHPRFLSGMDSVIWVKYIQPLQDAGAVALVEQVSWQRVCIQNFRACWDAMDREPPGFEVTARESLMQIAVLLYTHLDLVRQKPEIRKQRNSQRIKLMLKFIQEHYTEALTVAQIAASATLSESECMRCFRATIHMTPGQYLREYRLRIAAGLLRLPTIKPAISARPVVFLTRHISRKSFGNRWDARRGNTGKTFRRKKGEQKRTNNDESGISRQGNRSPVKKKHKMK